MLQQMVPYLLALALAACNRTSECTPAPDTADTADTSDTQDTDDTEVEPSLVFPAGDECAELCGSLTVPGAAGATWSLESDLDGFVPGGGVLDAEGHAEVCIPAVLRAGTHRIAAHVGGADPVLTTVVVVPFGAHLGLTFDDPLDAVPWVPDVPPLDDPAVLEWEPGAWDGLSVMMPSTVVHNGRRLLYYGGTDDETFHLGVAWRDDPADAFTRAGPILGPDETGAVEGDWNYFAQNTPEALLVDGQVHLYYNGRSGTMGGLAIGLATSDDGLHFTDYPANPVLSPTGVAGDFDEDGVAHPSVILRDGVYQLWYASGTLQIGYAVSSDGLAWERYCHNPVLTGAEDTWDAGHVKAPEVVYADGLYWMTYSGCGRGCYDVGWAASSDGIRWQLAGEPVLDRPTAPAWNSYGLQAAFVEVDGSTWRLWYTGTGDGHGSIGVVAVTR